ncbi:MAG: TRAP transporter fused permease subunit [Pseudolabrys sp.]|nr:TRAP transporter fused permease subunit [Pseudolabrys sp.]
MSLLVNALAVTLTCGVLAWAADLVRLFGLLIYVEQYIALMVALALPLVFLTVPAHRAAPQPEQEGGGRSGPAPWYDQLAALAGFVLGIYVAFRFPELSEMGSQRPWDGLIPAVMLCLLFLEGLRRTSGTAITVVVVGFFVLALIGHLLPGALTGRKVQLDRLTYFLVWDSSALFGTVMQIITTVVVAFVFFGNILFKSGGSAFFTDISMAMMGRYRGGPGKIAIMASSLFGTISGSVVANVVTTGVVTIPLMKKAGFRPQLAGAIEAVSSTGGQLMPPVMGIAAFLMAEFLRVPYSDVVLAALIPAVLFYLALFLQADLEAARLGLRGIDDALIPRARQVLKDGWHFPIPFVVLIGALFWLNYEPSAAALLAAAAVIVASVVFGFKGKRLGLLDFYYILRDTGLTVIGLFMIAAAAGAVIATLNYSGLGFSLTLALVHIAGGNLIALLVIAAIACIILGMGMPTVGVYILLATLVAPALIEMKVDPMAAHLFILYFGCLSMITPPVAIGAYAAAHLAKADPIKTGFEAVRFGWLVFVVPFLFVFSNTLLMRGEPIMIIVDIAAAVVGVWFGAAGVMGYSIRRLAAAERAAYLAAGLFLLLPMGAFGVGRWINLAGLVLAVCIMARERLLRRAAATAAP